MNQEEVENHMRSSSHVASGLLKADSMIGLFFKDNALFSPKSLSIVVKDLSK